MSMFWFFLFFIVSGFCSLVYQVTWLRVAMSNVGVTTPSISIVLSVFMAGLALGSWGAGQLVSRRTISTTSLFRLYALAEGLIGLSGLIVAPLLGASHLLLFSSAINAWGSDAYYLVSGVLITIVLLPFCTCMGATFPLAMSAIRGFCPASSANSFSYLYIANVLGAMAGCLCSALILIELLGFRGTMLLAALLNLLVAAGALIFASRSTAAAKGAEAADAPTVDLVALVVHWRQLLILLVSGMSASAWKSFGPASLSRSSDRSFILLRWSWRSIWLQRLLVRASTDHGSRTIS